MCQASEHSVSARQAREIQRELFERLGFDDFAVLLLQRQEPLGFEIEQRLLLQMDKRAGLR